MNEKFDMVKLKKEKCMVVLNILALYGVLLGCIVSFAWQFYYYELPCPLCVLQRVGLLLVAFGFILNMKRGFKASHYGFSLLALIFMIAVASRQVFLHIVPGTGTYGSAVLGLHLYTWVAVVGVLGILYIAVVLLLHNQTNTFDIKLSKNMQKWADIAAYFIWVFVLFNLINTLMICGVGHCPDHPKTYFGISL